MAPVVTEKPTAPDPLAIDQQFVMRERFVLRRADDLLVEPDALGQQDRRAVEALPRKPVHLDPPRFLVLRTGGSAGADLACLSQLFAGAKFIWDLAR